jgi:hypothetical protein
MADGPVRAAPKRGDVGLVICYGVLGFGYILPATFLPVLAHAVVASLPSSAAPGRCSARPPPRRRVPRGRSGQVSRAARARGSHLLMALGCLLPVLRLSPLMVLAAALLVGSTFMVATMAGMQAAPAKQTANRRGRSAG